MVIRCLQSGLGHPGLAFGPIPKRPDRRLGAHDQAEKARWVRTQIAQFRVLMMTQPTAGVDQVAQVPREFHRGFQDLR
jgi:hypothetical protein